MSRNISILLLGMAVGAGLMYVFDPQAGRRRQALMRDKVSSWAGDARDLAGKKARHMRNRAHGLMAEVQSMVPGQS